MNAATFVLAEYGWRNSITYSGRERIRHPNFGWFLHVDFWLNMAEKGWLNMAEYEDLRRLWVAKDSDGQHVLTFLTWQMWYPLAIKHGNGKWITYQ